MPRCPVAARAGNVGPFCDASGRLAVGEHQADARPLRPSSPHRSWRAGVRESSAGPKHVQRIALTLVGSALLGVLAWLLWWWIFLPSVYFVGLPIVDYDVLAVPPLRFAIEDVDAFSHLSRRGRGVLLRDLQISQGILTLANRLQGLAAGRRDTLILYLRAHGVSEDGKAWLLCSDYLPTAREGAALWRNCSARSSLARWRRNC